MSHRLVVVLGFVLLFSLSFLLALGQDSKTEVAPSQSTATPTPPPQFKGKGPRPERARQSAPSERLVFDSFHSDTLNQDVRFGVFLPKSYQESDKSYPVVYFLHGLFESEQRWNTYEADSVLDQLMSEGKVDELIVALPSADNSFYTDFKDGTGNYEQYISKEFVSVIESRYRVKPGPKNRAISGISMGGYGALKIAMKHPDIFPQVSAHSAMLVMIPPAEIPPEMFQVQFLKRVFGDPIDEQMWQANNPLWIAKNSTSLSGLKLYFDCGEDDRYKFYEGARELDKTLTEKNVSHEFHIFPGGHGWDYYKANMDKSFAFHSKNFR